MKLFKRIILSALVLSLLLTLAACSGGTDSKPATAAENKPAAAAENKTESKGKSFSWGGASFKLKGIAEAEKAEDASGKRIAVTIDFGKNQLSQNTFKSNVSAGKFLLAGKKPVNYDYHVGSMTLEAAGMVTKITGETVLYFDMDADYEINEADLVITE